MPSLTRTEVTRLVRAHREAYHRLNAELLAKNRKGIREATVLEDLTLSTLLDAVCGPEDRTNERRSA